MEVKDFDREVLKGSFKQPVVVDFWAPWCQPCLALSPVLEKLADVSNGKWKLLKVNVDNNKDLSAKYGIRGIPNVIMFKDGTGIDSFTGALPEGEIARWLEKHIPSELAIQLLKARELNLEGSAVEAQKMIEDVLAVNADNLLAKVMLAETVVFDHMEYAEEQVHDIYQGGSLHQRASAVRMFIKLFQTFEKKDELAESTVKKDYLKSIAKLRARKFSEALEGLIHVMIVDKDYDDEGARRGAIAIFHWLGESHAITQKHRALFNRSVS